MDMSKITGWVEAHPTESIVIGAGGLIAILYLLGYFSSSSSGSSGASSLASAYYAAEAQQAVVAGQIQADTVLSTAQTAQVNAQANAAVAINAAQSGAAVTINGQNAGAATTINQSLGSDALLSTENSNAAALSAVQSSNATAATINASNNTAGIFQTILGSLLPTEIAQGGGYGVLNIPGFGGFSALKTIPTLNDMVAGGLTPQQAALAGGLG